MLSAKFEVFLLRDAAEFLESLEDKAREKILYNIKKASFAIDAELFKKIEGHIWEFRTEYASIRYRMLAFWDKRDGGNVLVIVSHGFVKKTGKVPKREIEKAEKLRKLYFNLI